MIKIFSVHKIKISVILLVLFTIFSINIDLFGTKKIIYKNYPNLTLHKKFLNRNSIVENVNNDYNVKFLPDTQYVQLNLVTKKINFSPEYYLRDKSTKSGIDKPQYGVFYLEIINSNLWIVDYLGKIYQLKKKQILDEDPTNTEIKIVNSNFSSEKVLDTYVHNNIFYISFVEEQDGCKTLNIVSAKVNEKNLNFKKFFKSNECGELILGGRMQFYKYESEKGLLITTSNHPNNKPDNKPQDINSIFGKILFIDFEKNNPIIFSKGHRVAQGLYTEGNLIISTEHGPRGGDEINKILFNKNYGWPISSYGEKYRSAETNKPYYLKNHASSGFEEPIFTFVPSIGISEIISLPNSFSKHFENNFIVSSLAGKSLHRLKFDKNYNKVIFNEKIFIGSRIRDLKYHNKTNSIFLALEEKGEIGILTK